MDSIGPVVSLEEAIMELEAGGIRLSGKFEEIESLNKFETRKYLVRVDDGTLNGHPAVLKLYMPSSYRKDRNEVACSEIARDGGVPVPEIIYPGFPEDANGFILVDYVDSLTLKEAGRRGHPRYRNMVSEAAAIMAGFHRIKSPIFGYPSGESGSRCLSDFVFERIDAAIEALEPMKAKSDVELAMKVYDALRGRVETSMLDGMKEFEFVHGDYNDNNVLVDPGKGRVKAVIDWKRGHYGNRHADPGHPVRIINREHPRTREGDLFMMEYDRSHGEPHDKMLYEFFDDVRTLMLSLYGLRTGEYGNLYSLKSVARKYQTPSRIS